MQSSEVNEEAMADCHCHWWPNLEHAHPFKTLSLSLSPPELWLSDAKKLLVRQLFLTTTTQTRPFHHFYDGGGIFPENLKQKVFSSKCEKFSIEWRWRRQKRAAVVQWLARSSHNWGVRGSNPAATFFLWACDSKGCIQKSRKYIFIKLGLKLKANTQKRLEAQKSSSNCLSDWPNLALVIEERPFLVYFPKIDHW